MDASDLEVRVRYAETDQMGVAHHASYLVWFEAGRTEFIRDRGRSYAQIEASGWLLVVVEARCRYLRPARYDDVLIIRTRLASLGPASLEFGYEALRRADGAVLARGATVHAAVDRTGRPRRIPEDLRRLLGQPGRPPHPPGPRLPHAGDPPSRDAPQPHAHPSPGRVQAGRPRRTGAGRRQKGRREPGHPAN